ncbi:MAG: cation transporter [Bacteroidetes bacterium]|nr:cation transporter [Bacteroidota bacterium]
MNNERKSAAQKVTWIGFFANLLLMVFKLFAGIYGRSSAMIADAIHSLSDFATDLVVVLGINISSKPLDLTHKYGHGKVETLATAFIGIVLFGVGIGIAYSSIMKIYSHFYVSNIVQPGMLALYAALFSILVKEILFHYTIRIGKKIKSSVVLANAWHHRSDVFSSVGTLIGIAGAIFLGEKWVILDPIAALVVSFFIFKVAFKIAREAILELIETSLPKDHEQEILKIAENVAGVYLPHELRTRRIGNVIAIDLHINVKSSLNVKEAHDITVVLEDKLRHVYGEDTFISIHVEPLD